MESNSLQFNRSDNVQTFPVIQSNEEVVRGGAILTSSELKITTEELLEGTIVAYSPSTRVANIVKTAKIQANVAAAATTDIRIEKNHQFKVGDFITNGRVSTAITAIDTTTSTLYDALTLTATLDAIEIVAAGTVLYEGASETTDAPTASSATVEDTAEDYLTIAAPRGDANGIVVVIEQAGDDNLAIAYATNVLTISLANTTPAKNNASTIQTALRALDVVEGVDFSDWTATGDGWDDGQTGATLTNPSSRMVDGVERTDIAPKYDAYGVLVNDCIIDTDEANHNLMISILTRGVVRENNMPFYPTTAIKALLASRIQFV